jgi:antitoxin PrlF
MTETLTSDGLITIPKAVQELLDLAPGSQVQFRIAADGSVVLEKVDTDEVPIADPDRFEQVRGIAGPGPSTDEIMAELRGD